MGFSLTFALLYLGEALSRNPGYIKLRKIRAAQNISKTVSGGAQNTHLPIAVILLCCLCSTHMGEVKVNVTCLVPIFIPAMLSSVQIELTISLAVISTYTW